MPELPEVETIARRLREGGAGELPLVGRRIRAARVRSPRVVVRTTKRRLEEALRGRRIEGVRRRGKYLLFDLDARGPEDARVLAVHLRMTGDLHHVEASAAETAADRLVLDLEGGTKLVFTDRRHLGEAWLAARGREIAAPMGIEPLEEGFDARALQQALAGRRSPIKAVLLDQSVVAGLGNIYADEALFVAGIHPLAPAASLDEEEVARLSAAIPRVLEESLAVLQGRIEWLYMDRTQKSPFRVYGRAGEPCRVCRTPLSSTRVGGRITCFCPRCQPPRRTRAARGRASGPSRR